MSDNFNSVTVVIVNFNSGDFLRGCLKGLLRQTLEPDKIVIIDNCSTDGSADNLISQGLPLCVYKVEQNLGFAEANNLAVEKYVDSEWVALLNPDTVPSESWLETLLVRAQNTKAAMIGSVMVKMDSPETLDGYGDAYHASGLAWRIGHGLPVESVRCSTTPIFSACAGAALLNVDVFRSLGGFETSFFCYFEDVDYGFRLRLQGYKVEVEPRSIVSHYGGGCSAGGSDTAVYYGHRNLVWTYLRNMPGYLFWLYLPQHIALNILSLFVGCFRGQGKVMFLAKWHALKGAPKALSQRRRIQGQRTVTCDLIRALFSRGIRCWVRSRK